MSTADTITIHIHNGTNPSLDDIPTKECPICQTDNEKMIKILPCNHAFCVSCVQAYLENLISSSMKTKITCPQDGCGKVVEQEVIIEFMESNNLTALKEKYLEKVVNRDLNIKYCPKIGCAKEFTPNPKKPFTKCSCGTKICNLCCNVYHKGKSCLQVLDITMEQFARENNIKFCIICKTLTQKNLGCKHMTCPVCDYEWCWVCGREWGGSHDTVCPQRWSPKPPESIQDKKSDLGLLLKLKAILKIFLCILLSPLYLIGWLLILPNYYLGDGDFNWRNKVRTDAIDLLLIGVVCLPLTLFFILIKAVIFIITLPCWIKYAFDKYRAIRNLANENNQAPIAEKRWKTRKVAAFGFSPNKNSNRRRRDGIIV